MLRVTVLELPATWGRAHEVLRAVDAELERGPKTDLVLLPEASITGYVSERGDFDLTPFAEPLEGPTSRSIVAIAARHETVVVAPLVLREAGRCFNAMVAFGASAEPLCVYRKRHPWYPEIWATPGSDPAPLIELSGRRITIATCFDVHFLEEEASATLDSADLLLFPSAWVEENDTRLQLLTALARRHAVAVANANWGRGVVHVAGQGGSSILSSSGDILARAAATTSSAHDARSLELSARILRADSVV